MISLNEDLIAVKKNAAVKVHVVINVNFPVICITYLLKMKIDFSIEDTIAKKNVKNAAKWDTNVMRFAEIACIFGCPPCPYNCPGMCSSHGCINKCSLPCSHTGECQCLCVGYCNDCNCQITELHDKLKFWNNSILVCTKCFYRRVEWRRKGHPDELYLFMNS